MSTLEGKKIVLGVSGGIAAYKAVEVCRRLVDAGAFVSPVLTEDATRFIGEVTFSALASEPVRTSLWHEPEPIPHTRLGQSADLIVVAPATARVIGKYTAGISDDLLTATLLATRAPVLVCPAMHTEMWEHASVQENLATLRRRGVHVLDPETGRLAGGDVGAGRLADPANIVAAIERVLGPNDMDGMRVLISAGGTREAIDTVRVVTNRSSGKQGYALAEVAAARGAQVTLVTTVDRPVPHGVAEVVNVASAADMQEAIVPRQDEFDVIVMAAAVADFRPKDPADRKIKKEDGLSEIVLEPTHDFLVDLGQRKPKGQVLVGFAAETNELRANALGKLRRKNLDLIVGNDVSAPGVGFEHDTNEVILLFADGREQDVPLTDKRNVAAAVWDAVAQIRSSQ
ncbi:MAG TPA: bifunctional phosphopantothenoylcysteine decarboxylase/phosphopantothenate--cysteine ligase CoaBC [Acidimicrobiales bacterium]|jgi:phosphopantothenoylcysteine decarboxylase / phosphopantothenate---cysteine ligase|nr:bifunctional phosphopantothenoylcysteine decarboxylase/phosphopantothenate--cysteine ligase CoaBC [Acidimicrobiales bacterium]